MTEVGGKGRIQVEGGVPKDGLTQAATAAGWALFSPERVSWPELQVRTVILGACFQGETGS